MTGVLIKRENLETKIDTYGGQMVGRHGKRWIFSDQGCLELPKALAWNILY